MTGDKKWWQSRGMVGALAAIVAGVFGLLGVPFDEATFVDIWMQSIAPAISVLGGLSAWVGRRDARQRIE